MAKSKVKLTVEEGEEAQPIEILQSSILELARGMKVLNSTRLTQESIVTLVAWKSGVGKVEIRDILNTLTDLEKLLFKPVK